MLCQPLEQGVFTDSPATSGLNKGKETFSMCRLMKEIEKKGFNEGKAAGKEQGYRRGHIRGLKQGLSEGIKQGISEGIKQGISKGIKQGISEGIKQGIRQGRDEGRKEGEANTVRRIVLLHLQNGCELPEITKLTGASLKDVQEIAKSIQ